MGIKGESVSLLPPSTINCDDKLLPVDYAVFSIYKYTDESIPIESVSSP